MLDALDVYESSYVESVIAFSLSLRNDIDDHELGRSNALTKLVTKIQTFYTNDQSAGVNYCTTDWYFIANGIFPLDRAPVAPAVELEKFLRICTNILYCILFNIPQIHILILVL